MDERIKSKGSYVPPPNARLPKLIKKADTYDFDAGFNGMMAEYRWRAMVLGIDIYELKSYLKR